MKIYILTLFPEMFSGFIKESILARAAEKKLIEIKTFNLREWGNGPRGQVDDTPYGGGAGMVLKVDVVARALREIQTMLTKDDTKPKTILMTPQGKKFDQSLAKELAERGQDLILVCGHYEGFDERIRDFVDAEVSLGDFVLTGGEIAAAAVTDAVVRLLPGVLGKEDSFREESFEENLLEYPHYTRPEEFEGQKVPNILLSGNHAQIAAWRKEESLKRTQQRRPDLLK